MIIAKMDARLARVAERRADAKRPRALYITPGGVTAAGGTFVDAVMAAAGVQNIYAEQGQHGWQSLDLEYAIMNPPDLVIAGFFDLKSRAVEHWSIARHAAVRRLLDETPRVMIPSATLACSAWFAVDAVEAIADAADALQRRRLASRD